MIADVRRTIFFGDNNLLLGALVVMCVGFFVAPSFAGAAVTGNLDPTADSASSTMDSASWRNQAATTCSTTTCYTSLNDANDTTYIYANTINKRATFRIPTSSIPVGATVTNIAISFSGADNIRDSCAGLGASSDATVQTVRVVDGVATNSGTNVTMLDGVWATSTQNHVVSFVMNSTTTLEVGVVITAVGACSVASTHFPHYALLNVAHAAASWDTDISKVYAVITYTVPGVTVSGTIYSDEGSTAYNCSTNNLTVAVKINGSGSYSGTCTAASGAYSVSGITIAAAADVVSVFLDGETVYANAVTRAADTSSNISIPLYQDRIIVQHEDSGPITNTNIDQFDNNGDADMLFTITSGAFTGESGAKIVIPSGETYAPGGNVTVDALLVAGTYTASSYTLTLTAGGTNTTCTGAAGTVIPLCVSGTFTTSTDTVSYQGSAATTLATITYYNLTINGSGVTFTLGGATTVANDVTVTAGTLAGTNNLTVNGGDITGNGTINLTAGTATLTGAGNIGGSSLWTFYNLTLSGASQTTTAASTGGITTSNVLTISASHTLAAGSKTWTLSGTTGTPLVVSGTLTANTSTFYFSGNYASGNTTVPAQTYYNLTLSDAGSTETYAGTTPITVSNNLAIAAGSTFTAPASLTIGGNFVNSGTFTKGTGTVTFNATATGKTITTNGSSFYAVTFNGAGGGWTLQDATTLTSNLTMTTGTLAGAVNLTVTGNMTGDGIIAMTGATTTLSAGNYSFGGNSTWTFYNLQFGTNSMCTVGGDDPSITVTGTGDVMVTNQLFMRGSLAAVSAGSKTWILTGTGTPFAQNCSFSADTSRFKYAGVTSAVTVTGGNYYNLDVGSSTATTVYTLPAATTITVSNILTIATSSNGTNTFNANTGTITLSGTGTPFVIAASGATFTASSSSFNYTGAGVTTITPATYYNLSIKPGSASTHTLAAGTIIVNNNLTLGDGSNAGIINQTTNNPTFSVAGDVTVAANATFTAGNVSIGGNYANNGAFTAGTGTITFNGTSSGKTLSGTLTGSTGKFYNLYVTGSGAWTLSANGEVYNIYSQDAVATVTAPSTLTIGAWFLNDGTFNHNNGTVVVDGSGSLGCLKMTNNSPFYNLTYSGASASCATDGNLTIANDLTVSAGTFGPLTNITVGRHISGNGIINATAGTVTASSTGNFGGATNWTFNNLTFGNGSSASTITATSTGTVTVSGQLRIATSSTLLAGSKTWYVNQGGATPFVINGTFTAQTSTVSFGGSFPTLPAGSVTYYNLAFDSNTLFTAAGAITVSNDMAVNQGTVSSTYAFAVQGGDITGDGGIDASGGTATFTLTGSGSIGGAGTYKFYNLTVGSGSSQNTTSTGVGAITVTNVMTVATSAILYAGSKTWTLTGTGTPFVKNGTFTAASSTVYYAGITTGVNVSAMTYWDLTMGSSTATTTYTAAGDITVQDILTLATSTGTNTFSGGSNTITLSGSATSNGGNPFVIGNTSEVFTAGSSTVNYTGDPNIARATYYNLGLGTTADAVAMAYYLVSDVTVQGTLTVGNESSSATDTLYGSTSTLVTLTLSGSGRTSLAPFRVTSKGSFSAGSSTVIYSGNQSTDISNLTYNNLRIIPAQNTIHYLGTGSGQTITVNGNLDLARDNSGGTITAAQYNPSLTVKGNMTVGYCGIIDCGGNIITFTKGTATTTFSPTGTKTWTDNNSTKQDLGIILFSGGASSPQITLGSDVKATKLTVSTTLNLSTSTLTLTGTGSSGSRPFIVTGTFTPGTGTLSYVGTSTATDVENATYYNLTVGGANASTTYSLRGNTSVTNVLTIADSSDGTNILSAGSYTLTLSGTGTPFVINESDTNNAFSEGTGTVTYSGAGATTIPADTYYVLNVQPGANGATHTFDQGTPTVTTLTLGNGVNTGTTVTANVYATTTITVTGNFTNSANNTFRANDSRSFSVTGNFANSGTLTMGSNTLTLNGGTQALSGTMTGSSALYNLTVNNTGGVVTVPSSLTLTNTYRSGNSSQFTAPSNILTIGGDYIAHAVSTFNHNNGTTTLNGTAQQTLSGAMNFYNLSLTNNSGSDPYASPSVVFSNSTTSIPGTFSATSASTKIQFGASASESSAFTIGQLNLNGGLGSPVYLRPPTSTQNWYIKYTGSGPSVQYVDVANSKCVTGSNTIYATSTSNGGTNTNSGGNDEQPCWNFGSVSYQSSGALISNIIDTNQYSPGGVSPNSIQYRGIHPANTTVQFQIASANSTSGPWSYLGWNSSTQTCSASSYYPESPASAEPNTWYEVKALCHKNQRYIRYKTFLSTSDPATSSIVTDVILNYAK